MTLRSFSFQHINLNKEQERRLSAQNKVFKSLESRECIQKLCENPETILNIFNKNFSEKSINNSNLNINNIDSTTLAALTILKKLFRSLKSDIFRASYNENSPIKESELIHFLAKNSNEKSSQIIDRYVNKCFLKRRNKAISKNSHHSNWRQLEIIKGKNRKSFRQQKIPTNVPPLDADKINNLASQPSSDSCYETSPKIAPLNVISDQIIPSNEATSLSSSSSSSSSSSLTDINDTKQELENLQELSKKVTQEIIESARKVQEQVISPRKKELMIDRSCGTTPRINELIIYPEKESKERKYSKEVQTNFGCIEKIDVGTLISLHDLSLKNDAAVEVDSADGLENISASHILNNNNNNNTNNTSSQVTGSTNSTSAMYSTQSERSAGQISMQKATLLMTKSKFSLISVNVDGSLNSQLPTASSRFEPPLCSSTPFVLRSQVYEYPTDFGIDLWDSNTSPPFDSKRLQNLPYTTPLKIVEKPLKAKTTNSQNSTNKTKPYVQEWRDDADEHDGKTTSQLAHPLVVKEFSIGTSFDSSSNLPEANKKNLENFFEKSGIPLNNENSNKPANNMANSNNNNNKSASTTTYRGMSGQGDIRSSNEDEEESTLNQVSPLPTTG